MMPGQSPSSDSVLDRRFKSDCRSASRRSAPATFTHWLTAEMSMCNNHAMRKAQEPRYVQSAWVDVTALSGETICA